MRIYLYIIICVLTLTACSKKKETRTIITKIEAPKVSKEIKAMADDSSIKNFTLGSKAYTANIVRTADKELPIVRDSYGNKFYDNSIELTVTSSDEVVLKRQFTKTDFMPYVNTDYIRPAQSILVGMVFTDSKGGKANFTATVGSPDEMDDQFMLVRVSVSANGATSFSTIDSLEE